MENMTWVKLHDDSLWNLFFVGLVNYLKTKLKIIKVNGSSRYTCGAPYHHESIPDWKPFRHFENYCLEKGYDDMVVMELIVEKTGRKIICECELVLMDDPDSDKRARLQRSFGMDFNE